VEPNDLYGAIFATVGGEGEEGDWIVKGLRKDRGVQQTVGRHGSSKLFHFCMRNMRVAPKVARFEMYIVVVSVHFEWASITSLVR